MLNASESNRADMQKITSPLTGGSNVVIEGTIPSENIVTLYRDLLGIEVARYFADVSEVTIYRCLETQYRFYFPFGLAGDSKLYEDLSRREEFYPDWKWEYLTADGCIRDQDSVLEIGSGNGAFIKHLESRGVSCLGLEINQETLAEAERSGMNIIGESIQEHSATNDGRYDIVCSFQVLEHIADVHSFLASAIKCLKVGGTLIIGVPNNGSFIRYDSHLPTNLPPHHMGLWDENSLSSLEAVFALRLKKMFFQPILEDWEHEWFYRTNLARVIRFTGGEGTFLSKATYTAARILPMKSLSRLFSRRAKNHTVVASYEKVSR